MLVESGHNVTRILIKSGHNVMGKSGYNPIALKSLKCDPIPIVNWTGMICTGNLGLLHGNLIGIYHPVFHAVISI